MFSEWVNALLAIWPWILLSDFLRYIIPVALLSALLAVFHDRLRHRKIQERSTSARDHWREFAWSMSTVLIFSLVGLGVFAGEQVGVFSITKALPEFWPGVVSLLLMIVVHDAYFYWAHRLMHDRRLFVRFHRLHHLSRAPRASAAYAFAVPEALVEAIFFPLYLLLVETSSLVIFLFLTHMILRNVAGHAGYELFPRCWIDTPVLKWITTTTHHDMHHEGFRYNFGLYFTWWDRWMGTEHPLYRERFLAATRSASERSSVKATSSVALLLLLLLFDSSLLRAEQTCGFRGLWVTEGFSSIVYIDTGAADKKISATPVWIFDDDFQQAVGKSLFFGMSRKACVWTGGRVLNPENDKYYRGSISLEPDGRLKVAGCFGPFCKTQFWRPYEQVYKSLPNPIKP